MKVTDYIVTFLIEKGVTDVFGYPGGVICHLMDSITKYPNIKAHINYHEQAAAFAACAYAQATGKLGVAYTTSGPGATNLITGIANAYFDSIPALFITGQVDTYGVKGDLPIRQRGFQETDTVTITQGVSVYSVFVEVPEKIKYYLEKAYHLATTGRPGPVVLDIPADVQRADVDIYELIGFDGSKTDLSFNIDYKVNTILSELRNAKRPIILAGAGIKQASLKRQLEQLVEQWNIPIVFSMPAFDMLPFNHRLNMGFLGVNGHRYANFALSKSDLIITMGSRLDLKQVGNNRNQFAENSKLLRIDIDEDELKYKVRNDEVQICCDIKLLLPKLLEEKTYNVSESWTKVCKEIKDKLLYHDKDIYHKIITEISDRIPDYWNLTVDVGQHQLWVAQAFHIKGHQSGYMSAGLGSMGYSLPAAIGVYYATRKPVVCFNGDGGIQMNIQELQFIKRENLPIKIVILNNYALGMIRQFQEKNFEANYFQTTLDSGYSAPDFCKIAMAYEIAYYRIDDIFDIQKVDFDNEKPAVIEVCLSMDTYLNPNHGFQKPIHDQIPLMERELYDYLMSL